jgi:hypothetical protein
LAPFFLPFGFVFSTTGQRASAQAAMARIPAASMTGSSSSSISSRDRPCHA